MIVNLILVVVQFVAGQVSVFKQVPALVLAWK